MTQPHLAPPQTVSPPILIAGLGNHAAAERTFGRQVHGTRHNAGYELLSRLAAHLGLTWTQGQGCTWAQANLSGHAVVLVAPNHTDLNHSGQDLALDWPQGQVIALLDDMDLDAGCLRLRASGSSGGHKGLQSVIDHYGQVRRIRYGIDRPAQEQVVSDHVMGRLSPAELGKLDEALPELLNMLAIALSEINRPPAPTYPRRPQVHTDLPRP